MDTGWQNTDNKLQRTIVFSDFSQALAFVNKVGELAEVLNHPPDICIKDYRKVHITTTTHDKNNTITDKDYQLADAIDKFL